MLAAINDAANADLRVYPDPEGTAIKNVIVRMNGLAPAPPAPISPAECAALVKALQAFTSAV